MIDSKGWENHPLKSALPPEKFEIQRWNALGGQHGNHCDEKVWYALAPPVVRAFHTRLIEVMDLPPQAFSCIEVGHALTDLDGIQHRDNPDSGQLVMIVTLQGHRDVSVWRMRMKKSRRMKKSIMRCTRGHVYIFPAAKLDHQVWYSAGSLTLALRSPGLEQSISNYPKCPGFLD